MKRKIRIGIDVDDCICNTLEMDYACALFMMRNNLPQNIDKSYFDVTKSFKMNDGERFYIQQKEYIMKHNSMYPKVFVKEVLSKLREKGFEIVIITARYDKYWNGNAELYLKNWLKQFDIEYDELYANISDKIEFCLNNKIECLIEDKCENVMGINDKGVRSILLTNSYNKNYSHALNDFAETWLEVYSILAENYGFDCNDIITFD